MTSKKGGYRSADSPFKNQKTCNPEVVNNLLHAIKLSNQIECVTTPDEYFKKLYKLFIKEELRLQGKSIPSSPDTISLDKYLKKAECDLTYEMFRRICSKLKKENVLSDALPINVDDIQPNDVLSIQIPSILADHHYLTAVVSSDGETVTVYQSFGYNKSLHKKILSITDFKDYLNFVIIAREAENFDQQVSEDDERTIIDIVKEVEEKLFFVDFEAKLDDILAPTEEDFIVTREEYLEDNFDNYKNSRMEIIAYHFLGTNCGRASGIKHKKKTKKQRRTKRNKSHRYKK